MTTKMHVAVALQDCLCFDQCEPTLFHGLIRRKKKNTNTFQRAYEINETSVVSNECRILQLTAH